MGMSRLSQVKWGIVGDDEIGGGEQGDEVGSDSGDQQRRSSRQAILSLMVSKFCFHCGRRWIWTKMSKPMNSTIFTATFLLLYCTAESLKAIPLFYCL